MANTFTKKQLEDISPQTLREYLVNRGWRLDPDDESIAIYTELYKLQRSGYATRYVRILADTHFNDYYRRVSLAIQDIADAQGESLTEIYMDLHALMLLRGMRAFEAERKKGAR